MPSLKKQTILQSITDFLQKNGNVAFIRFEKTTHTNLETLRKLLKQNNASIKVVKNSILEKALNQIVIKNKTLRDFRKKVLPLKENTALLGLGAKWSKGLHVFYEFIQKEKTLTFKIGFLDSIVYSPDDMNKIAQLPEKDVLIAKLLGSLNSPMSKLAYAIRFNMQKLVIVLNEKAKKG